VESCRNGPQLSMRHDDDDDDDDDGRVRVFRPWKWRTRTFLVQHDFPFRRFPFWRLPLRGFLFRRFPLPRGSVRIRVIRLGLALVLRVRVRVRVRVAVRFGSTEHFKPLFTLCTRHKLAM